MRIIGEPRCSAQALDQSESELSKVILVFTAKFSLPGEAESDYGRIFHRIFVRPPEAVAALAMNEEEGRDIVKNLLESLLVPNLDEIIDPVFTALVSFTSQITDWSLGIKASVTIDVTVENLPSPLEVDIMNQMTRVAISELDFASRFDYFDDDRVPLERVTVSAAAMECSVCWEDLTVGTEVTRLPCSHIFHGDCIIKWLNIRETCPLCRFIINAPVSADFFTSFFR